MKAVEATNREKWMMGIIAVLIIALVAFIAWNLLREPEVQVKYVPEVVDMTPYNDKIKDLEKGLHYRDSVMTVLQNKIDKAIRDEKSNIIISMGIENLDDAGRERHARQLIVRADSLRRAGHSWYTPFH